jgi:hypothetical protein
VKLQTLACGAQAFRAVQPPHVGEFAVSNRGYHLLHACALVRQRFAQVSCRQGWVRLEVRFGQTHLILERPRAWLTGWVHSHGHRGVRHRVRAQCGRSPLKALSSFFW